VSLEVLIDGDGRSNRDGDDRDTCHEWARCCRQSVVGGDECPIVIVPAPVGRMSQVEGCRRWGMVAGWCARNAVVVRFARGTALFQHDWQGRHRDSDDRGSHNPGSPEHGFDCIRVSRSAGVQPRPRENLPLKAAIRRFVFPTRVTSSLGWTGAVHVFKQGPNRA
jgi:hypothetical protein